jgi:glycosyltransferase involved in cell wall biosynthesis
MKSRNRIAIVITSFNSENYIEGAINSVLAQKLSPDEFIIIDNGSTDNTQRISEKFSIPFFKQIVGQVGESRNLGIRNTTAPLIKFLDADDFLTVNALEDLHRGYVESGADFIYGKNLNFVAEMASNLQQKSFAHTSSPIFTAMALNSLLQRSSFTKYGLPDQDNYSWNRWLTKAKASGLNMHRIEEVVGQRRIHDSNVSHDNSSKRELFELIASNIKTRRSKDV